MASIIDPDFGADARMRANEIALMLQSDQDTYPESPILLNYRALAVASISCAAAEMLDLR